MRLSFSRPQRPHTIYVLKSYRDKYGKSTTKKIETLGSEEEIERKYGCADGLEWAKKYVEKLNEQERLGKEKIKIELSPTEQIAYGEGDKVSGGDLMLLPLYNGLGLPKICESIKAGTRVQYDLNEILEALVVLRILYPCSKKSSFELNKKRIRKTTFELEDVYRALSLLSGHIDQIQAQVWKNSQKIMERNTRVIFYDCTNYYFEIEDNDRDYVDTGTGEVVIGLRKRGKSKEHRPNPIVQMGLLMDGDGIPLSFIIFPGNESEQPSLKRIEEMVAEKFGLNEFVISTDAGLGSEDNRRYNMTEGREYITVQSLPSLPKKDQDMALDPRGWRVAFRESGLPPVDGEDPQRDVFDLSEIDLKKERHTRFYKEIIVDKTIKGDKSTTRSERVIVTYSHDFALYLQAKRAERLAVANRIVKNKQTKSRQSQQDPRNYVETVYVTKDGVRANKVLMSIDRKAIEKEKRFDGFYAYGTSLDDDALDVLRARAFHHEIEHLFRTTKTFLDARPVHLHRQDRIKSHFLICFLAMVILKMLQKQLDMPDLTMDRLINQLRNIEFDHFAGTGFKPLYGRNELIDRLQEVTNIKIDTHIIKQTTMNAYYRMLK